MNDPPLQHFAGRAAAIAGGADGIGRALAEALADAGMRVAILDVRGAAAQETAAAIGRGAIGVACDVTLPAPLDAAQRGHFDARADAIRAGMHFWQDRDRSRWPDRG